MRRLVAFSFVILATSLLSSAGDATPLQTPSGGQPDSSAELRKQLADPKASVRLNAALALAPLPDEAAIGVLIELLADLGPAERRQAEQVLQQLAGDWAPNPPLRGEDEVSRKIRSSAWAAWWRTVDGPALLAAFRRRTLSNEELAAARNLIDQLADKSTAQRERAQAALIEQGSKVIGLLRAAAQGPDADVARRAELCLKDIALKEAKEKLPTSAPRLLAARKPAGASAALLAYVAFTDDRVMKDEIGKALASLIRAEGKADPAVLQALSDPLPVRRIVAAEALAGEGTKHWPALRKLLGDADPEVRLRVALALVNAQDKAAVPALIDLLAEFPRNQASEAEQLLQALAGEKSPAVPWGADDAPARAKLQGAWKAWWTEHGATVNMADLEKARGGLGLTLVAEVGGKGKFAKGGPGGNDRVVALDRSGQIVWQITNLSHPIDVQLLPGNRVLIAEYGGNRVTERDLKGNILWEHTAVDMPVNVQRLANGNTFIALTGPGALRNNLQPLLEVDPTNKTVASFNVPGGAMAPGPGIRAADIVLAGHKLADGKMVCLLFDGSCVWLDATGKELKRFAAPRAKAASPSNAFGSIDVTPKGNVLFAQTDNAVVEYDMDGKVVWQASVSGCRATRLANGNTLVVTLAGGVVELDTTGRTVWQYNPPAGFQAARARRQ